MSSTTIHSLTPTVFFKALDASGQLLQLFRAKVSSSGKTVLPVLETPGERWEGAPLELASGTHTVDILLPDIRQACQLTLHLDDAFLSIAHKPFRHWSVHLVQFAHHDFGYTDIPSNVLREMAGYLDDCLLYCRQTDDFPGESRFRYTIEQGWSLLWWIKNRPENKVQEMMERIREGRIEVNALVGNQTTELHSSEELIRALYPVFALKRQYGINIATAEHNDIPGISWGVAEALSGAGIRYFAPGLPDYFRWGQQYHTFWDEEAVVPGGRPHAFWWESLSGKRLLFWYHTDGAGGPIDPALNCIEERLTRLESTDYPFDLYRLIVRGGERDNSNIRIEYAQTAREWNSRWAYPRLITSLNSRFFPLLEQQLPGGLPVFRGELPGTDYSPAACCTAGPSSLNRNTHSNLSSAERFAALARLITDAGYPADYLAEAWECMLTNDEHCWGLACPGGPGMDSALAQHNEFAYRAAAIAHDVSTKSLYEIADRIEVKDKGYHVALFNPLAHSRSDVAVVPFAPFDPCSRPMKPVQQPGGGVLYFNFPVTSHGLNGIPFELVQSGLRVIDTKTGKEAASEICQLPDAFAPVPYAAYRYNISQHAPQFRYDLRFVAEDIPPMGWKLFRVEPGNSNAAQSGMQPSGALESRFYRLQIDPETGRVRSLLDKTLGLELLDAGTSPSLGQLFTRSSITSQTVLSETRKVTSGESGDVSSSLLVESSAPGFPRIRTEYRLYHHFKRLDISVRVLKDPEGHLETFVAFPFDVSNPRFRHDATLCQIRPGVDQFPGSNTDYYSIQNWAEVGNAEFAIALSSLDAPVVQFSRNWPLYISQAHHGVTPQNFDHPFHSADNFDQAAMYSLVLLNNYRTNFSPYQSGDFLFRYSITSYPAPQEGHPARDFGTMVHYPLQSAGIHGPQQGTLPYIASWVQVEPSNLDLLALKQAEDTDGVIVRVKETEGKAVKGRINLPGLSLEQAVETNVVEEDGCGLSVSDGGVVFSVEPWQVVTIRIRARLSGSWLQL